MPITYSPPIVVQPAAAAVKVQNTDIAISDGGNTVFFGYTLLDGTGKPLKSVNLTVTAAYLTTKYPANFATVYAILKRVAYQEIQDAGLVPIGGVVS